MSPRFTRPLLVAVAGTVLITGVSVGATPASAAPAPSGTSADGALVPGPGSAGKTGPASSPSPAAPAARAAAPQPAADPGPPPAADPGDTTAPTGSFKLSLGSLWIGQSTSLTQVDVADNGVADPASVTRIVAWGDGTTSTLSAGQGPIAKQYTKAGKFTVTLTLTDGAGNSSATSSAVTVTVPGKVKLSKYTVWPGELFTVTLSGVPAGTTKITVDWGDGWISTHKGVNQSIRGLYYHRKNGGLIRGAVTLRVAYTNINGTTSWISGGKVNVRTDSWKPVVKVTKPSRANRASSWKTVGGTVSDKGAGAPAVFVWVTRVTGNKVYCFTPKKKWVRVYSEDQYNSTCRAVEVKAVKGKWSMKLGGVAKGTLYVDARTWDWGDNASKWSSIKVQITR